MFPLSFGGATWQSTGRKIPSSFVTTSLVVIGQSPIGSRLIIHPAAFTIVTHAVELDVPACIIMSITGALTFHIRHALAPGVVGIMPFPTAAAVVSALIRVPAVGVAGHAILVPASITRFPLMGAVCGHCQHCNTPRNELNYPFSPHASLQTGFPRAI
jgi:hypothetical protein